MLAALALLASFIWLRDLRWWDAAEDSLPILAALPLFYWLQRPWKWTSAPWRISTGATVAAAALFMLGVAADSGLVLAAGWTTLLWAWLSQRTANAHGAGFKALLVFPLLAFPWVTTDAAQVGWWFRLSGAAATESILTWTNFNVVREGTLLWVDDFAVSVEAACSGVNGLQAMLVAGGALAFLKLGSSALFWWNIPLLVAAAWLANLLRILVGALCAGILDPYTAAEWIGPVHSVAGWIALCVVFILCNGIFAVQEQLLRVRWPAWLGAMPWLEIVLIAYFGWRCHGLLQTWLTTPYDRLGWLAFLIWLLPLFAVTIAPSRNLGIRRRLVGIAIALTFLGGAADVNALHHLGFASLLIAIAPHRFVFLWAALGTLAWLPASGWLASRLGLSTDTFALTRVALAVVATSSWLIERVWTARNGVSASREIADAADLAPTQR